MKDFLLQNELIRDRERCNCGAAVEFKFRPCKNEYYWQCTGRTCQAWLTARVGMVEQFPKISYIQLVTFLYLWAKRRFLQPDVGDDRNIEKRARGMHSSMSASATAMNDAERRVLHGTVEVDETLIGSVQKGLHGRPSKTHGALWRAFERGSGEFIMLELPDTIGKGAASRDAVLPYVRRYCFCAEVTIESEYFNHLHVRWIAAGSTIMTDGLRAYLQIPKMDQDYQHFYVAHNRGQWANENVHIRSIEGQWGNLKMWLKAKHGVGQLHLLEYVSEYEWKARHADHPFLDLLSALTKQWDEHVSDAMAVSVAMADLHL